jgi:hypothetical protein
MGLMLPASILLCNFWAIYEGTGNTVKVWADFAVLSMFIFFAGYAVIIISFSYTYIPESFRWLSMLRLGHALLNLLMRWLFCWSKFRQ